MATIPSSGSARADTRDRILRAAAALFGARGLHATRTADIAARARTTERTLFKHFQSKDELYAATLMPALVQASVLHGLAQTGQLLSSSREEFRAWQDRLLTERLEQSRAMTPQIRMLIVTLLTDPDVRASFARQWKTQVWDEAIKAIKAFQKRGLLRTDVSPEQSARMIICVNLGFVLTRLIIADDMTWDDDEEIRTTGDFIERGLAANPSALARKPKTVARGRRRIAVA